LFVYCTFVPAEKSLNTLPSPMRGRCVLLCRAHPLHANHFLIMTSNSFRYATKVWLTSVVVAPFLYFLISGTFDIKKLHIEAAGLGLYTLFAIAFGLLFSIPCWTILIFAVKIINKQNVSLTSKKVIIILIGVVLTYLLFYLLFFKDRIDSEQLSFNMRLATAYCLTNIIGMTFYKLEPDLKGQKSSTQHVHL